MHALYPTAILYFDRKSQTDSYFDWNIEVSEHWSIIKTLFIMHALYPILNVYFDRKFQTDSYFDWSIGVSE